ncbi:uncharacterized protein YALI1_C20005g [Yarrowia lipolytica]|uniref:Uncharacterized protein n=1 Tax=Yarrowia lipolytica TaxID=4952 RepID=A0A1D8NB65_YARLL|nr:hypothetical protein YALI1_C20005g [Yarrowia lipolytica]
MIYRGGKEKRFKRLPHSDSIIWAIFFGFFFFSSASSVFTPSVSPTDLGLHIGATWPSGLRRQVQETESISWSLRRREFESLGCQQQSVSSSFFSSSSLFLIGNFFFLVRLNAGRCVYPKQPRGPLSISVTCHSQCTYVAEQMQAALSCLITTSDLFYMSNSG